MLTGGLVPEARAGGVNIDVDDVAVSPDISIKYFGEVLADEQASVAGSPGARQNLGQLPPGVELTGFHVEDSVTYFAIDQTIKIGGIIVTPQDVARTDGNHYELVFKGASEDIPRNTRIDAVTLVEGSLTVSFDTAVKVGGQLAADEDLVLLGGSSATIIFDGSVEGVPPGLDLDAAHFIGGNTLALSLDGSAKLGEILVHDEDVFSFDGSGFAMLYDGSAVTSDWGSADVNGVFIDSTPPAGLIFEDSFESGNTTEWSVTVP